METLAERLQKEARIEGKRETVLAFLKNGVDIDTVVKSTGFTREEVEKMVETVH